MNNQLMKLNNSQIWILFILPLTTLLLLSNCESVQKEEPPNIILLFTDDQTYQTIHALGNEVIKTPHLDRLVQEGTTFTHAYNMGGWHGAICVASRSMMISGAYLWDAQDFEKRWRDNDSLALAQTWGRIMADHGYSTYLSGKWHILAPPNKVFDQVSNIRPGMPGDAWGKMNSTDKQAIKTLNIETPNLASMMPVGYHRPVDSLDHSWSPDDPKFGGFWQGGTHWSEVLKEDALRFLKDVQSKENPFFMYLAFNAPHDPRQSPREYLDLYSLEEIPLPNNWQPVYPDLEGIGAGPSLRDEALAPFPRTPYATKTHIKEYYAIISHLDAQIGDILQALENTGKIDNTYIFFTADHGLAVGQHGLIGKQNMYDHSMRVPFIVKGPGIPRGKTINQPLYLQDIMPTSLELAGIPKPSHVSFNSIMPMIRDENAKSAYSNIYGAYRDLQRMISDQEYKLILYPRIKKELLFDLKKDPLEKINLANDSAYWDKKQSLFQDLINLQKEMNDTLDLQSIFPYHSVTQH